MTNLAEDYYVRALFRRHRFTLRIMRMSIDETAYIISYYSYIRKQSEALTNELLENEFAIKFEVFESEMENQEMSYRVNPFGLYYFITEEDALEALTLVSYMSLIFKRRSLNESYAQVSQDE